MKKIFLFLFIISSIFVKSQISPYCIVKYTSSSKFPTFGNNYTLYIVNNDSSYLWNGSSYVLFTSGSTSSDSSIFATKYYVDSSITAIPYATEFVAGILGAADFTTFTNKLSTIVPGTGVTVTTSGVTATVNIGQPVATTSSPTFVNVNTQGINYTHNGVNVNILTQSAGSYNLASQQNDSALTFKGSTTSISLSNTAFNTCMLATASTSTLSLTECNTYSITGTSTINAIADVGAGVYSPASAGYISQSGAIRTLIFSGTLQLTNSSSLILPTGANITTAAGDAATFVETSSSPVRWTCVDYTTASGYPLAAPSGTYVPYTGANATVNLNNNALYNVETIDSVYINLGGGNMTSNLAIGGIGASSTFYRPLSANTTGINNVAVGQVSMRGNTTGSNNTALGNVSLNKNVTGSNNTAIGSNALVTAGSFNNNTAVGYEAFFSVSSGYSNTALGFQAGDFVTTGSRNVIITGAASNGSGTRLSTGSGNVILGYRAAGTNNSTWNTMNNKLVIADTSAYSLISGDFGNSNISLNGSIQWTGTSTTYSVTTILTSSVLSQGFITSTTTILDTLTLPSASSLLTQLATVPLQASTGTVFSFIVNNTGTGNTFINLGTGGTASAVSGLMLVSSGTVGGFRIIFQSPTTYQITRTD